MKEEGFSLIELLIVVAIVGIISAIAIPNLLNARKAAYGANAVRFLKSWVSGQEMYKKVNGFYADADEQLVVGRFVERGLNSNGVPDDLAYTYSIDSGSTETLQWFGRARRKSPLLATLSYYVDQSGVVRAAKGNTANVTDTPIE